MSVTVPPVIPDSPKGVGFASSDIGVGDNVSVKWNQSAGATSYDVTLENIEDPSYSQTKNAGTTSVSFNVNRPGTYRTTVIAKNSAGSSGASSAAGLTVHEDVNVTFVDGDGNVIPPVHTVKWNGSVTAPVAPIKEGHDFQGWDQTLSGIKTDLTVCPKYKIRSYIVKFVDKDGSVLKSERVNYGSAATPPDPGSLSPDAGFVFSGWSIDDYKNVKEELTVQAVYAWENDNLPILTQIISAKRNNDATGYDVKVLIPQERLQRCWFIKVAIQIQRHHSCSMLDRL